ncbi:uncharacterized protein V6R79_024279 [Siganus canaliculatus]
MTDLYVSVAVLGVAVVLSEATRWAASRLAPGSSWIYLLEAASTFQLCCCTHELKLLGESTPMDVSIGLALTYTMTVIHLLTFREATCNPYGVLESLFRGSRGFGAAVVIVAFQFAAAVAAQYFATTVWSLALSDVHVRHQRFDFRCFDPLGGTVLEAAAVELACAFVVQAAAMYVHKLHEKVRVHFFAAIITVLVYAGGSISGAMFNPVLAFSVQFPCSGHTYLEYCFVFWLGPALGMTSCILLFEKIVPFLSGKSGSALEAPVAQKKKKKKKKMQ